MNEELARFVTITCLRSAEDIAQLFHKVAEHDPDWASDKNKYVLAMAINQITEFLRAAVYNDHPELEEEMIRRAAEYGSYF